MEQLVLLPGCLCGAVGVTAGVIMWSSWYYCQGDYVEQLVLLPG